MKTKASASLTSLFAIFVAGHLVSCTRDNSDKSLSAESSTEGAAAGNYSTSAKLSISDVQPSFEREINGHGHKNATRITEFLGVYQEESTATVFYVFSGYEQDRFYKDVPFEGRLGQAECKRLTDDRWLCVASFGGVGPFLPRHVKHFFLSK